MLDSQSAVTSARRAALRVRDTASSRQRIATRPCESTRLWPTNVRTLDRLI
jgi:hypothetical protein